MLFTNKQHQINVIVNKRGTHPANPPFTVYKKNAWFLKKHRNIAAETVARLS